MEIVVHWSRALPMCDVIGAEHIICLDDHGRQFRTITRYSAMHKYHSEEIKEKHDQNIACNNG